MRALLFLPAYNEAQALPAVLARVPTVIMTPRGALRVHCLVIDDGSEDRTAAVAGAAGAAVIRHPARQGLGAVVRRGLAEGVRLGAEVVAFCDADGEYDPAQLPAMVAPILGGRADYVVGSRFRGHIGSMRLARRLGNHALTALLRVAARAPVTDGQSGYRALSRAAAADADIAHDYNYAQVLTLDLLAKGARYAEVPISYRFRRTGRSFVRLAPYLRHVLPVMYRMRCRDRRTEALCSSRVASG